MGYDTRENGNQELLFILGLVVVIGLVVGLVVAITSKSTPITPSLADPRRSVVSLPNGVSEFCDGTTMVYKTADALTTSPNNEKYQK